MSRSLPTATGSRCSKVLASAATPGRVHTGLVGEGVAADVGAVGVRRHVAELVEVVRGLREAGELLRR